MVRKERLDREFDEELTTHLELLIDEGRRRGMSHTDARREALRKLGRPVALREVHREQIGLPCAGRLRSGFAVRRAHALEEPGVYWRRHALARPRHRSQHGAVQPGRRSAASLAAGARAGPAGSNTSHNARGRTPKSPASSSSNPRSITSAPPIRSSPQIVGFDYLDRPTVTIDGVGEPSRQVEQVTENYFRDLGVTPIVGRMPDPSDDRVAIISYGLWRARFGSRSDVLGRAMNVDGQACTIIGVAPPRFLGLSIERTTDLVDFNPVGAVPTDDCPVGAGRHVFTGADGGAGALPSARSGAA